MIVLELFDLIIDRRAFRAGWRAHMGEILAAYYGGDPAAWLAADDAIRADWDSYYADLDLGGDDSLEHLWEGRYRTTRALFRLTGTPEPAPPALTRLSRTLAGHVAACHDAAYASARAWLIQKAAQGIPLGIVTGVETSIAEGALIGAGLRHLFTAPILGVDALERFAKDADFYRRAWLRVAAARATPPPLLIDPDPTARAAAAAVGFSTAASCADASTHASALDS